jgi:RecA-family ATPase
VNDIEEHEARIAALAEERFGLLADVKARKLNWLWPGFLPYEMGSICDGYPDVGKSYLGIHIAAQLSIGGSIAGEEVPRARSLILTTENHAELVLRPRFDKMGGDANLVSFDRTGMPLDDEGFEVLEYKVREWRPKFILIDPLLAYVPPGSNMYHPNVIRPFMARLDRIIQPSKAALLSIRHPTKTKRDNALYQGAGGVDIIAAARCGFIISKHPQDEEMRVVAPMKANIYGKVSSCMFDLPKPKKEGELPRLRWRGECNLSPEDLMNANVSERAEALKDAVDWVRSVTTHPSAAA